MFGYENRKRPVFPSEGGFDNERQTEYGVMCLLTYVVDQEEKVVLVTVPKEDVASTSKAEKLARMIELILIGSKMLAFPGGRVEPKENLNEAMLREVYEEIGLILDSSRLKTIHAQPFEVTQLVSGSSSRQGLQSYQVAGFTYQLNQDEFAQIHSALAPQDRRVVVISWSEAQQLQEHELRPSSRGLLEMFDQQSD